MSVRIAPVTYEDGPDLIAANRDSVEWHQPWVQTFIDRPGFEDWFDRQDENNVSLIARSLKTGAVVGIVSLSQIFRRGFQNAYLSYYGSRAMAGRGMMTDAVRLGVDYAFGELGLHRVEANIQPGNDRSVALIRRLGFRLEGFSPRYLYIDGDWRDHQRWAMLSEDWPQADGAAL